MLTPLPSIFLNCSKPTKATLFKLFLSRYRRWFSVAGWNSETGNPLCLWDCGEVRYGLWKTHQRVFCFEVICAEVEVEKLQAQLGLYP